MTEQKTNELHNDMELIKVEMSHIKRWIQGAIAVGLLAFSAFAWQINNVVSHQTKLDDRFYTLLKETNSITNKQDMQILKMELENKKETK